MIAAYPSGATLQLVAVAERSVIARERLLVIVGEMWDLFAAPRGEKP